MSALMKDLVKPPFATYDIVVYFGGGLFSIPFFLRYLFKPLQMQIPSTKVAIGGILTQDIVSALVALFSIYILGHLIAYLSSQMIEGFSDRFFGKISRSIILTAYISNKNRNKIIRLIILRQIKSIPYDKAIFATIVRSLFHLPMIIHYAIVIIMGIFGYLGTRLSRDIIELTRVKCATSFRGLININASSNWFKAIEYHVINNNPAASARMYNYLVIYGLFRSLSFVFLASSWVLVFCIFVNYKWNISIIEKFFDVGYKMSCAIELTIVTTLSLFCSFCLIKFKRRYIEEAMLAFALTEN